MKKYYYYCDMDGVLADFNAEPRALERFEHEPCFFENLAPIAENVAAIKELIASGASVRILSASPNAQADNSKRKWLKNYIPELSAARIILMRIGQNKADYVKTKGINILFDDYGKNCRQWNERANHQAYKIEKEKNIAFNLNNLLQL